MSFIKTNLTPDQKSELMAQAFASDSGMEALAQSMVEPIRNSLEYQAVGRKLLLVDELPQGVLPRYEKDVTAEAYQISRRGAVVEKLVEAEEVLVQTFPIATNPKVLLTEIAARRFYVVDRAQIKAKEAIQKQEDSLILNTLIAAAVGRENQVVRDFEGDLSLEALNDAFVRIEQHDLVTAAIVCHPFEYGDIRTFGKEYYDEATTRVILTTGLYGHLWTANIHVTSRMTPGNVLCVAVPETVGVFPIRQNITVLPCDEPQKLMLGWVIFEEIGIAVLNDYAVSLIQIIEGDASA